MIAKCTDTPNSGGQDYIQKQQVVSIGCMYHKKICHLVFLFSLVVPFGYIAHWVFFLMTSFYLNMYVYSNVN